MKMYENDQNKFNRPVVSNRPKNDWCIFGFSARFIIHSGGGKSGYHFSEPQEQPPKVELAATVLPVNPWRNREVREVSCEEV